MIMARAKLTTKIKNYVKDVKELLMMKGRRDPTPDCVVFRLYSHSGLVFNFNSISNRVNELFALNGAYRFRLL